MKKTDIEQLESILENAKTALELAQREMKSGWPFDHPARVKIKESISEIDDWEYFKRELE